MSLIRLSGQLSGSKFRILSIVKVSQVKVVGCVLGFHFFVFAIVLLQPACQTTQGPTQVIRERPFQDPEFGTANRYDESFETVNGGLDAAFNAGFDVADMTQDGEVLPLITPITSEEQTVEVLGSSFEVYTVKRGDSLWSIARRYNVSLKELYADNGLNANSILQIGQQIRIPVESGVVTVDTVVPDVYQPSSLEQESIRYTVQPGDSLSRIAQRYGTSVSAIKAANGKTSDLIRSGESLIVPLPDSTGSVNGPSVKMQNSGKAAAPYNSAIKARTHQVQLGEYPAMIARKYGISTDQLMALNGITNPLNLQVGQVLKISDSKVLTNEDSLTQAEVVPIQEGGAADVSGSSASVSITVPPEEIAVMEADPILNPEQTIPIIGSFEDFSEVPIVPVEEE